MDFLELAQKRYSSRKYEEKKVEEEKLLKILEAGRVAPSAGNLQPVKSIVIREKAGLNILNKCTTTYGAPIAIIVCGDHTIAGIRPSDRKSMLDIDVSIVIDHMMLEATSLGLGSVWIGGAFDPNTIKKEFNLPEEIEPVSILAIGYSADKAFPNRHDKTRKALSETIMYENM